MHWQLSNDHIAVQYRLRSGALRCRMADFWLPEESHSRLSVMGLVTTVRQLATKSPGIDFVLRASRGCLAAVGLEDCRFSGSQRACFSRMEHRTNFYFSVCESFGAVSFELGTLGL
ncbi:hypothetical protein TcCL_NonESM05114 [Trypanosoma cruzi]|nr:hypothetical protein TcCL_NonESM05114 [Trypanosoma cruzi]